MTTLTAIRDLMYDSFEVHRVLVVAPLRVARDTWPEEIRKWDHLKDLTCSIVVGTVTERRRALQKPAEIYIVNRENLVWLWKNCRLDFDMVVLDELPVLIWFGLTWSLELYQQTVARLWRQGQESRTVIVQHEYH